MRASQSGLVVSVTSSDQCVEVRPMGDLCLCGPKGPHNASFSQCFTVELLCKPR